MLVLDLCTESVKESKVFFDDINDDFISKHVTFRLRHKFEVIIEESSTVGENVECLNDIFNVYNRYTALKAYLINTGVSPSPLFPPPPRPL